METRTIDTVMIPASFYHNGIWQAARWSVTVVDEEKGDVLLMAVLGPENGPTIAALRMSMQDVAVLRRLAGFEGPVKRYDCRTTDDRLAALEAAAAPAVANRAWMDEIEKRLDALERETVIDRQLVNAFENRLGALEEDKVPVAKRFIRLEQRFQVVIKDISEISRRLATLERMSLGSRVTYLENFAQGITGPDAGL